MLNDLFFDDIYFVCARVYVCVYACDCVCVCEHMSVVLVQLSSRLRDSCDTGIIITNAELMFVWM